MRILSVLPTLVVAGLLAAGSAQARISSVTDADRARALPVEGPVNVRWDDPAKFSEITASGNRWEAQRGNWVYDIAKHIRTRALKKLPQGERLDVTIHDIRRAGNYEPWRGPNADTIRFVRDIYPPRMTLSFELSDASGRMIAHGERKLTDLAFTTNASAVNSSDTLRYEKRMVDDWLRNEFEKAGI